MQENRVPVVRVVVRGCPSTRSEHTNVTRARNMLLRAFEDNHWPGNAMFTVTPGGFVHAAWFCARFAVTGDDGPARIP